MVSRRTNFGERSEPASGRGGKLQSAGGGGGGAAQSKRVKISLDDCTWVKSSDSLPSQNLLITISSRLVPFEVELQKVLSEGGGDKITIK